MVANMLLVDKFTLVWEVGYFEHSTGSCCLKGQRCRCTCMVDYNPTISDHCFHISCAISFWKPGGAEGLSCLKVLQAFNGLALDDSGHKVEHLGRTPAKHNIFVLVWHPKLKSVEFFRCPTLYMHRASGCEDTMIPAFHIHAT